MCVNSTLNMIFSPDFARTAQQADPFKIWTPACPLCLIKMGTDAERVWQAEGCSVKHGEYYLQFLVPF